MGSFLFYFFIQNNIIQYNQFTYTIYNMNIKKAIILITITSLSLFWSTFAINNTHSETISEISFENDWFSDNYLISGLKLPWTDMSQFEWDKPILLVKDILNKVIEYSPFIIFIMLLFGCFKMIVSVKSDPGETGKRIIKQVLFWAILLVLCIYGINIASIYLTWFPLINFPK